MKFKYVVLMSALCLKPAMANMPVFDFSNFVQNTTTANESIAQTKNQIQQYKTQLEQYQSMLDNSKTLTHFQWDDASNTMTQLMEAVNTIDYQKEQAGSLSKYLEGYQSIDYYQNHACKTGGSCSEDDLKALKTRAIKDSQAEKRANDAALKGIDHQQQVLKKEAKKLSTLQKNAEGAKGQMEAIQAANQLASAETNQLLQIRGVLVSQQNLAATRAAVVANKEAMTAAADERFRAGKFKKSPKKSW